MTVDANYREWNFGKTEGLPDGPWKSEPDKVQWIDTATGLDCLIVRNAALCGYVGVPPEHPWHGKGYSECLNGCGEDSYCYEHSPDAAVRVHGGLTFADGCNEAKPDHVCHVPAPGRPGDVWWFGFDCGHGGDLTPLSLKYEPLFGDETYKDIPYVRAEVEALAEQLAAVA
jgi:hypothetical protein